jgi:phage nucleotide-binding protein
LKIEKAPAKIDRGISFIIFSDPGIGKTTLSTTLPAGKTLIINTEAGLGPLLGTDHLVFNVRKAIEKNKTLEDVINGIHTELKLHKLPEVTNVVIDNMSELVELLIMDYTTQRNKSFPELKEHGDTSYKIREWMHSFRDLVYDGYNVVFNAWEFIKEIRNSDGVMLSRTIPMIGNKIAFQLSGIVDAVGHLEVHEKTGKRWVRFGPSNQFLTKCQFKGLENGELADLPLIIDKLTSYDYSQEIKEAKDED